MELALAFIGAPLVTYLVLASLPGGKPALIGVLVVLALVAVLWVTQKTGNDAYMMALITLVFSAVALAGLVQTLRVVLGLGRPRWLYPLIVVLALLGAGIPALNVLGV